MKNRIKQYFNFDKTDIILWIIILSYTAIIYLTLSIVSKLRKYLVETFGYNVFDKVYWIFGFIAVLLLIYCFKRFKGRRLYSKIFILAVFCLIYTFYLSGMKYTVERIHFLEYGVLGVIVYKAFGRHIKSRIVFFPALCLVYWIGLGDETLQWFLSDRVGEIRDSMVNLISGALGIGLVSFLNERGLNFRNKPELVHFKMVLIFLAVTTAATAVFLCTVHGFGYEIETKNTGRFYSSLSKSQLNRINSNDCEESGRKMKIYNNEAIRHLFQREFYFTNDFKASDGSFYKDNFKCFYENQVLEYYYKRFLEKNANRTCGSLIESIDKEVAEKVKYNPVKWSESLRNRIKEQAEGVNKVFTSRVKSTIFTSFRFRDFLFYTFLVLILFTYIWVKL